MPRRNNQQKIIEELEKYGYSVYDNFQYKNNTTKMKLFDEQNNKKIYLSLKQIRYRQKHGRSEYDNNIFRIKPTEDFQQQLSSFDRFNNKQDDIFKNKSQNYRQNVFNETNKILKLLMKKRSFDLKINNDEILNALIFAMKMSGGKINMNVRMTIIDENGHVEYAYLNQNTIDLLNDGYLNKHKYEITDSMSVILDKFLNIDKIHFDFVPFAQGHRINPGLFPYLNKSDIDLSNFGIFKNINDDGINESCLYQTFKASNIFNEEQLKLLKSMIKTRTVPKTQLKNIAKFFNIYIKINIYYEDSKESHDEFGDKSNKKISILVVHGHYMLKSKVPVTKFYLNNYDKVNNDSRFKNNNRRFVLCNLNENYKYSSGGTNILTVIELMKKNNLLVKINDSTINNLKWKFDKTPVKNIRCDECFRKVIVNDKKQNFYLNSHRILQSKHFFGYKPESYEIAERLNEIQEVVNSLQLRKNINVRQYYKFSDLMQKIMYEFGCYDNVYELTGEVAENIRNQIVFPKTKTFNNKPFYSNEKLYYIDLNGAYISTIKSIPTGIPNQNNEFEGENTKIKELIELLYYKRLEAKNNGKDKLAKTLKYIMTSCWGYSIMRPKNIKHKYCKDVDKYINEFAPYVLKYSYNEDNKSGYVDSINSFVEHFTTPQFAKSMLDNYNNKISEIKKIVNIYYENIDALLINENDYKKLLNLGYIGENIGQFKIEHIFTEIAIKSSKTYVATLLSGEKFLHCLKTYNYDDFVLDVKSKI